ncbi:carbohydrate ABC transporter permease [Paenibacillus sp.]|uniref:carbohydrate ABC transporter permease n=1 Tax=Paenibacillus sp. TaxID=58172 RepID=UPI0028A604D7|nr:carbohydrate ABC transporter permease [Paenibacillus sp.]
MGVTSKPMKIFTYAIATVVFLIYIVPFLLILITSLKNEAESKIMNFKLPTTYQFDNYLTAINEGQIWRGLSNGLFVSLTVTILTVLLCSYSAFIMQRNQTRFTRFTYKFLLAGMIAPFSFIPAIKLLQLLHMGDNYSGLIMVDIASQIPFTILLYYSFFYGVPREMDEAASVDGASPIRMFFQVIFPLLMPVVSTNIVLTFTTIWNDFSNVLFLVPKSSMWTIPMGIFNFQQLYTYNYALVCAYITLALIPVLIIYLLGQKYIVSGMTTGAVKG